MAITVTVKADGTLDVTGATTEQLERWHKYDGVEPKKDDEWTAEDFKQFPDAKLYKWWNKYDRARYRVMKSGAHKAVKVKKDDNLKKLRDKLAELKIDNAEINAILDAMDTATRQVKSSTIMKLFGREEVMVGDKCPLNFAMFYSEKGERMQGNEDLVKFITRVGNITQKYKKSQIDAWIDEINKSDAPYNVKIEGELMVIVEKPAAPENEAPETPAVNVIKHGKGNK